MMALCFSWMGVWHVVDEQQAVPVAQEDAFVAVTQADRDAVQAFHHVMLLRLMSDVKSQRPKLGDDEGDAGTLVQAFARHRLASLPCKSGEGAGECACGCAGDPFICIEADGTDRAAPEGLDTRCGFSAGSPKSPEWMAACEQLALRFNHWKLNDKAAQIRGGHPAWLIEQACVEAILALTPDATQTRQVELVAALKEARETFQQIAAALREHDAEGLAQVIAVAELTETGCVAALSDGEPA